MKRFFNTGGPVNSDSHYAIDPLTRLDLDEILMRIQQQRYFALYAPSGTGKTSFLLALANHLNQQGDFYCLYVSLAKAQAAVMRDSEDVIGVMEVVIHEIMAQARLQLGDVHLQEIAETLTMKSGEYTALNALLTYWSKHLDKPLVLLLDDIDVLVGPAFNSLLRQLRSGFDRRPEYFPQCVVLCGLHEVRSYQICHNPDPTIISSGYAFNLKIDKLRLPDFTHEEVEQLYQQNTNTTGLRLAADALERVWTLTQGQPTLVNALGEMLFDIPLEMSETFTVEMVNVARETLLSTNRPYIDRLRRLLQATHMQKLIPALLSPQQHFGVLSHDEIMYALDLGFVSNRGDGLDISNLIYQTLMHQALNVINTRQEKMVKIVL